MVRIPALERLFSDPPRGFSPTPLWWWSGGRVTTRRLRWQLDRCANVQGAVTSRHPTAAGHALRLRETRAQTEEFVAEYDRSGRRLVVTSVRTAFDYLSKPAVELLLDKVHHEFDRRVPHLLGNVIAGSFQDELPATNSWTPRFPAGSD